jgi:hypothetical protein
MFISILTSLAASTAAVADGPISIDVNGKTGGFTLSVGGATWFTSGETKWVVGLVGFTPCNF